METLDLYDYVLPEELIATKALPERGSSKLLVLEKKHNFPRHDLFNNLINYLKPGDVLVVNNTKVRKARIKAFKKTGGNVEVLLVRPLPNGRWTALLNGKGPFLPGSILDLDAEGKAFITVVSTTKEGVNIYEIACDTDLCAYAEVRGELPLPPYFKRRAEEEDYIRYQTVFAKELGAVAAPTAGLHFTDALLSELQKNDITIVEVTLHVGIGTFLPIRSNVITDHKMHTEFFHMDSACAERLNEAKMKNQRIIPVGTTSMRVVEQVMQWAHEKNQKEFFPCSGETSLFIRPGYQFLGCNAMITNFHLPRTTLLVLVSAVAGRERILQAYQEAVLRKYRFFSYGDACFLEI